MLLKTPFQKICYKLFLALIAAVYGVSAYVAPSDAQPIAPQEDDAAFCFAALADSQVSNYILKRVPYFDAAAEDLHNAQRLDAALTANGVPHDFVTFPNSGHALLNDMDCTLQFRTLVTQYLAQYL